MKSIAVLMTCFNRKDSTLQCLKHVKAQEGLGGIDPDIYLVDDGSTDGTGAAVRALFPEAIVLQGDGELYWGGGMRLVFGEALKKGYDYYLWLNDDSMLYSHALLMMIDASNHLKNTTGNDGIVSGAMQDAASGGLTYGGSQQLKSWKTLTYKLIEPTDQPVLCDVVHGNCVLIPKKIAETVGNLSADFTHRGGDYDYSLRARALGFLSWITPGYVGVCKKNPFDNYNALQDKSLPLKERVRIMAKPTAIMPAREWMLFVRRHGGGLWPLYWLRTLVRRMFPWVWLWARSQKAGSH